MTPTTGQSGSKKHEQEVIYDADRPSPVARVLLRTTAPVEGFVCAQFMTMHLGGGVTAAGLLSMTQEEWESPAWQKIRDACDVVEDIRGP